MYVGDIPWIHGSNNKVPNDQVRGDPVISAHAAMKGQSEMKYSFHSFHNKNNMLQPRSNRML